MPPSFPLPSPSLHTRRVHTLTTVLGIHEQEPWHWFHWRQGARFKVFWRQRNQYRGSSSWALCRSHSVHTTYNMTHCTQIRVAMWPHSITVCKRWGSPPSAVCVCVCGVCVFVCVFVCVWERECLCVCVVYWCVCVCVCVQNSSSQILQCSAMYHRLLNQRDRLQDSRLHVSTHSAANTRSHCCRSVYQESSILRTHFLHPDYVKIRCEGFQL